MRQTRLPRERGTKTPGPWQAAGEAVAARRRALSLTQPELADLAQVGVSTVRAFEAGNATTISGNRLAAILDVLGLALVLAPKPAARALASTGGVLLPPVAAEDNA